MMNIIPANESEITRVVCPHCKERVARIGIKKESCINGLTFRCRRCGMLWELQTTAEKNSKH